MTRRTRVRVCAARAQMENGVARFASRRRTAGMRSSHASLLAGGLAALLVLAAPDARADESTPATVPVAEVKTETRWYGWQTLVVDLGAWNGAGLAVLATGDRPSFDSPSTPSAAQRAIVTSWLAVHMLATPAIHYLHGHGDRAGLSFLLRVGSLGLGLIGGAGVGTIASNGDAQGAMTGGVAGGTLGLVTPIVIDAAFLTKDKVEKKPSDAAMLMPSAAIMPKGDAMFGLGGAF